jgi:3-dehydroquinate synthase
METVRVNLREAARAYDISVGAGLLARAGAILREAVPPARRVALFSNPTVFARYGRQVAESLEQTGFTVLAWQMGDGERHKNWHTLERALDFLLAQKFERHDAVVALGGGVVGDLAGCAAALYLRGLPFAHIPTTLLAQIDASVGGKTAVNTKQGKNLIGVFHQPVAVIIDPGALATLPRREVTAGWCEAVKQGAAGDAGLFARTVDFLTQNGPLAFAHPQLAQLIAAQCAFKAEIVAGDEREDASRTDARSRRILNFGHTVGHALETVTRYRRFRHGEAVGYGMLAAGELSKRLALLNDFELESLQNATRVCGKLPRVADIPAEAVIKALAGDKKSVGGYVKWILLERLGRARIVDGREISPQILREALREALRLA